MADNKALVHRLLFNATNLAIVKEIVAENATYVSLNYDNPELTSIEPWCGTHKNAGPVAIYKTFVDLNRFWRVDKFEIETTLADGDEVAVFGHFRYTSRTLNQVTDSPFAVLARFERAGRKIVYMQFMEDTLSSSSSFRKSGRMVYVSNPDGHEVVLEQ